MNPIVHIHRLKFLAKNVIAHGLYYSGLLFLLKSWRLRNRLVILTYHRILPWRERKHSFSHSAIMVDDQRFNRHLPFLKKHFVPITTDQLIEHFEHRKPFPNSSCLITFDDGWRDNYDFAAPLLRDRQLSALVFPAMDYVGSGRLFWQEAMGHGFYQLLQDGSEAAIALLKHHGLDLPDDISEAEAMDRIRGYVRELKALPYAEIDSIIEQIETISGPINYGDVDAYLSQEQINDMRANGIDFGSHACSHRILTRLDDGELDAELNHSRSALAAITGRPVTTLAYPNGNYDNRVGQHAQDAGYSIGFGTRFGHVSADDDPYDLKRININDTTSRNKPIFLATILGLF